MDRALEILDLVRAKRGPRLRSRSGSTFDAGFDNGFDEDCRRLVPQSRSLIDHVLRDVDEGGE